MACFRRKHKIQYKKDCWGSPKGLTRGQQFYTSSPSQIPMMPNSFLYDWSSLASYSSSRLNFKVKPSSLPGYLLVMSSVNFEKARTMQRIGPHIISKHDPATGRQDLPTLRSNLHNSRPLRLWKSWKWRLCPSQSVNRRSKKGTSHLPILLAVVMSSSVLQSVRGQLWACRESTAQQRRSHLPVSLRTTSAVYNTLRLSPNMTQGPGNYTAVASNPPPKPAAVKLCRKWEPVILHFAVQFPFRNPSPS